MKALIKGAVKYSCILLTKCGIIPQRTIIKVDGGVCSQMHFYLIGEILSRRGCRVMYDYDWFEYCGMDIDGRFCRKLELGKMFPSLDMKGCDSSVLKRLYRISFTHKNDYFDTGSAQLEWMNIKSPVYLDGYYRDPEEMYGPMFKQVFDVDESVLDGEGAGFLLKINEANSASDTCAIHVRRGDLSRYLEAYGAPASIGYFKKAVEKVKSETLPGVKFFMFSDEPEWCEKVLIPAIEEPEINLFGSEGSDKGYCDLILMSRCHHQITSQGSLGKYAALLRPDNLSDGMVTFVPNDSSREWLGRFANSVVIPF